MSRLLLMVLSKLTRTWRLLITSRLRICICDKEMLGWFVGGCWGSGVSRLPDCMILC
jgi:hypothetical protein